MNATEVLERSREMVNQYRVAFPTYTREMFASEMPQQLSVDYEEQEIQHILSMPRPAPVQFQGHTVRVGEDRQTVIIDEASEFNWDDFALK